MYLVQSDNDYYYGNIPLYKIKSIIKSKSISYMKAIYSKLFLFLQVSGILSYRINVFRYSPKSVPFLSPTTTKKKKKGKNREKSKKRHDSIEPTSSYQKVFLSTPSKASRSSPPQSVCLSNGTEPKSLKISRAESPFAVNLQPARRVGPLSPDFVGSTLPASPTPRHESREQKKRKKEEEGEGEGNRRNRRPLFRALPRFRSTRSNYRL